jgi:hypothetical protein
MSYKLGLLLSMFFLVQVFPLGGDLASITAIHNQIDAIALTAGYQISLQGSLTQSIVNMVQEEAGARIYYVNEEQRYKHYGETVVFLVSKDYKPFVMSHETMTITVRRSAVIGYFA